MLPLGALGHYREAVAALSQVTLAQAAEQYALHKLALKRWRPSTANTFRFCLKGWLEILGDVPVREIRAEDVERLWITLSGSGLSLRWLERSRVDLLGLWKYLLKHDAVTGNPIVIWEPAEIDEDDHLRVYHDFSPQEVQRLSANAEPPIWRFIWTACYTGLRRGNLYAARKWWLEDGVLEIPSNKFKQRRKHRLPLHPALDFLNLPGRPEEPLLPGLPSSPSCLNEVLQDLGRKAGLPVEWVYPHQFRRTFCAWLKKAGVTREEAMDLLGTTSESVLIRHYWPQTTDGEKRISIEKI